LVGWFLGTRFGLGLVGKEKVRKLELLFFTLDSIVMFQLSTFQLITEKGFEYDETNTNISFYF